jgi:hypothetical protein
LAGALHKLKIGVILGIVGGCTVVLLLVGLLFILYRGRLTGYRHEVFVDVAGLFSFLLLKPITGLQLIFSFTLLIVLVFHLELPRVT